MGQRCNQLNHPASARVGIQIKHTSDGFEVSKAGVTVEILECGKGLKMPLWSTFVPWSQLEIQWYLQMPSASFYVSDYTFHFYKSCVWYFYESGHILSIKSGNVDYSFHMNGRIKNKEIGQEPMGRGAIDGRGLRGFVLLVSILAWFCFLYLFDF